MKRTRIRSVSKRDDRTMERKLDAMWQNKILIRAKGRCEVEGCCRPATVGHHIAGRVNKPTRHMINNGIACCQNCHDLVHRFPGVFLDMLKWKFPLRYEIWETRHHLLTVPYHVWMEERMKELKP